MDEWRERGKVGGGWRVDLKELEPEPEPEVEGEDDVDSEEEADIGEEEDEDEDTGVVAGTPSKKRKPVTKTKSKPTTPRKRQKTTTATPSKSASKAKTTTKGTKKKVPHPKSSTSNLPATILPENLPTNPYERALRLLHVGATPDSLPCREEEFVDVLSRVEEGVEGGGGGCLCRSTLHTCAGERGVLKLGQISLVYLVQARQRLFTPSSRSSNEKQKMGSVNISPISSPRAEAGQGTDDVQELAPFSYVEINGLKIPSPQHAYTVLWEAISGVKGCSSKTALRGLEGHFGRKTAGVRGPRGHTL